ncbi:unnamed protein product [Urochloa humidicola]
MRWLPKSLLLTCLSRSLALHPIPRRLPFSTQTLTPVPPPPPPPDAAAELAAKPAGLALLEATELHESEGDKGAEVMEVEAEGVVIGDLMRGAGSPAVTTL